MKVSDVVRDVPGGVEIRVFCKPGAKRRAVAGLHGDALKVKVESPALEGKANDALIDLISRVLGVPRSKVTIATGDRSRIKKIRVTGPDKKATAALLERAIEMDDLKHRTR